MNRNGMYRRLRVARLRVGSLSGATSHKELAQRTFKAVLRVILVLLALGSTAHEAVAQSTHVYVVNARSNTVSVIDRFTGQLVSTIAVGAVPVAIAVAQDAARAYVANSGTNTVSVIDTTNDTLVATVKVGSGPVSLLIADPKHAYVANARSNSVSIIDTLTQAVVATVPVGPVPNNLTVTPDGVSVWVTNAGDHSVSIIDTGSHTVTATVPVGANPFAVVAPPPAPTCNDGIRDGFETDVDCGGPVCAVRCASGRQCSIDSDCTSGHCSPGGMGLPPPNTCL